jgi:hypothetical protein
MNGFWARTRKLLVEITDCDLLKVENGDIDLLRDDVAAAGTQGEDLLHVVLCLESIW